MCVCVCEDSLPRYITKKEEENTYTETLKLSTELYCYVHALHKTINIRHILIY